jgi:hypothetical protein
MTNTTATEFRRRLRQAGFNPLPLRGKVPALREWQRRTEASGDDIRLWETLFADATNTGALCRLMPTLDIDVLDQDAAEAVENLVRDRFEERGFILVRVGKAPKRAIPFRTDQPFAKIIGKITAPNGATDQKLELLCDGQQCVVAGIHPDTGQSYSWHGGELGQIKLGELPYLTEAEARTLIDDAVALLVREHGYTQPENKQKSTGNGHEADWATHIAEIIAGRELHDNLTALAAELIASGMGEAAAVNFLRDLLAQSNTPRGQRFDDRLAEIPRLVASAARKFQRQDQQRADATIALHWHGEASDTVRNWLVDQLLPEVGAGLVSGQWSTYKTFVVLDLAAAVMAGDTFIDRDVIRRGGVLFIAAEGAGEIPIRLAAVLQNKFPILKRAPFAWTDQCPRLLDPRSGDALGALAQQARKRMAAEFNLPLALIVIDTLIASAGFARAGDENDAAAAQLVMNRLATLARNARTLVLGVDHFGKTAETGTRGSSAKEGSADVVLALLGDKSITGAVTNTKLALRKSRVGASGQEFPFNVRVVDLGADEAGRPVTSLVIDWGRPDIGPAGKDPAQGWAKSLRLLRRCLMNVLATDAAHELRPFADGPTVRAINIEAARAEFYRTYPAIDGDDKAKQATRQKAFRRAVVDAQERGLVALCVVNGTNFIWLTQADPS